MPLPQFWSDLFWFHFLHIPLNNTVILRIFCDFFIFLLVYFSRVALPLLSLHGEAHFTNFWKWWLKRCESGRASPPYSFVSCLVLELYLLVWSWTRFSKWAGVVYLSVSTIFLSPFFWERNKWLCKLRYSGTHGRRMNLIFEKKPIMFFKAEHIE